MTLGGELELLEWEIQARAEDQRRDNAVEKTISEQKKQLQEAIDEIKKLIQEAAEHQEAYERLLKENSNLLANARRNESLLQDMIESDEKDLALARAEVRSVS